MTFIGVAVGLGNSWRFPYMAAAFGGGAFLLVYLGIVLAFGVPAAAVEFTLGRLTRRGVGQGRRFYFVPDFDKLNAGVIAAALGQVFFSLSLGGTFHVTYGSYLSDRADLPRSAWGMAIGDSLAAVFARLIIVPAAVTFGLDLAGGPPLTFVTVPRIFGQIVGGSAFATLFFGLLFFAAFLSAVAGLKVVVAMLMDEFRLPRWKAVLGLCGIELLLAVPAMRSVDWILTSDLFWGSTMQPVGSACALLALVVGKGRALEEVRRGARGRGFGALWFYWIRYVVPVAIVVILVLGLKDVFATFRG